MPAVPPHGLDYFDLARLMNFRRLAGRPARASEYADVGGIVSVLRQRAVATGALLNVWQLIGNEEWRDIAGKARADIYLKNPLLLLSYPLEYVEDLLREHLEEALHSGVNAVPLTNSCCSAPDCAQVAYQRALVLQIAESLK